LSNSEHHVYRAAVATHIGEPADGIESERIAWVSLTDIRSLVGKGEITASTTLAALLYVLSEA
jgi:hypothetical protein